MTDQQPATLPHDLVGEIRPDKDTNTIPPRACRGSLAFGRACIWARAQKCRLHRAARILQVDQHAFFEVQRDLYRQPTRGGFSTVGTIVIIHRCGLRDRSSWTDRTMPKNFDPFKVSSAGRPLYWALRQRRASTELLVSTVCMMTSSGHPRTVSVKR